MMAAAVLLFQLKKQAKYVKKWSRIGHIRQPTRTGVYKLRPAGRMWPSWAYYAAIG